MIEGGKERGKSAAKIRKKPEDGHLWGERGGLLDRLKQKLRFDTRTGGERVGVRPITNKNNSSPSVAANLLI